MNEIKSFARGSEWRLWDLHVHTPASFHWHGAKFDFKPNSTSDIKLVDEMISALNEASPDVFGIMDYWTFDGWFLLQERLRDATAPTLLKKVFPGIELRLTAPRRRLNAHVIFSDETSPQALQDFKSTLRLSLTTRPLSDEALIEYARTVGADILKSCGFEKTAIDTDDKLALQAGCQTAEIEPESYKKAIDEVPKGMALEIMPFDTNDGLGSVDFRKDYAYALGLFRRPPIFEVRDPEQVAAFLGIRTPGNTKWFDNFASALGNVPRLAVSGSDAHKFRGIDGDNNNRGYGNFPSGKKTWIKADPTFLGLHQAVKEPEKRSFIGDRPAKLGVVEENKTYFIDSVSITRAPDSSLDTRWLDGCHVPLNFDLVAIIGNKGSGKSALSDVIALLGNSRNHRHFTFLKEGRFLGKKGEPAKHFIGRLTWLSSSSVNERRLSEQPSSDIEVVRYIPQGHFETLCNEHLASGGSNTFEIELRDVIFSHLPEDIRLGALDFDQLIDVQEAGFRSRLIEYRKEISQLNQDIVSIENQLHPDIEQNLRERLSLKVHEINEHQLIRPEPVENPNVKVSDAQAKLNSSIQEILSDIRVLDLWHSFGSDLLKQYATHAMAHRGITERLQMLERNFKQFEEETRVDCELLGIDMSNTAVLTIDRQRLLDRAQEIVSGREVCEEGLRRLVSLRATLQQRHSDLKQNMDAPQLRFQQSVQAIELWQKRLNDLTGNPGDPETLKGIEERLAQLSTLPEVLLQKRGVRRQLCGEVFDTLDAQRGAREALFLPVQELIESNKLIRDEYGLRFLAKLNPSRDFFADALFSVVKQTMGDFNGVDKSNQTVNELFSQYEFFSKESVLELVSSFHDKLTASAASGGKVSCGISPILRKDRLANEVYDLLFGLTFLQPQYSLLFQDTPIEQLSPGQRGALLLIFYLLVDKGHNPLIIDQPEENLDNQTVVSLLVPVINEAKKRRQIIMVTHNPNLAVVCDAEQIICSSFDRKDGFSISYKSGSIENPETNALVVNVLEGTMPAFTNRRRKYHES